MVFSSGATVDRVPGHPARRSLLRPAPGRLLGARLLLWFAVLSFATPIGAIPIAGASSLPLHVAAPVALSHPIGPVMVPTAGSGVRTIDHEAIPGSSYGPGIPLTVSELASVKPLTPVNGSLAQRAALNSTPHLLPGAATASASSTAPASTLGVGALVEALRARSTSPPGPLREPYAVPIGTVSGFINDTYDRAGIAGVAVQVYSSALCSTSRCPPSSTTINGSFTVICPAGGGPGSDDALVITGTNWYMDNVSHFVCVANTNTWIGTVYLVRDGVGIGFVKDPTTGKAIVGVNVQAITRDGTILGYPAGVTGTNGSYMIGLPPVPSKVAFTPPSGYLATFNYTNATPGQGPRPQYPPWTGGVNLGVNYLVRETLVKAELYDSVTMNPVSSSFGSALQACDALGNGCQTQGIGVSGSQVKAFATPGVDYFIAISEGHVQTSTPAITIPQEPPGTVFDMGKIWETPLGMFKTQGSFSAPAGGTPPFGAPNIPSIFATVCSQDGYASGFKIPSGTYYSTTFNMSSSTCNAYGCWILGHPFNVPAPPLRSFVQITPDTTGQCSPFGPTWPIPSGYTPTWINSTEVNITAGQMLARPSPVYVNFTVGDYVAGNAYVAGTANAPPCFIVTEASTDNVYWNTESYNWNTCAPTAPSYSGCNSLGGAAKTSFCIAVPPGNSKITVTAAGYTTNWTWAHVPNYCCHSQPAGDPGWPTLLRTSSADRFNSVNLTPQYGEVWGYVIVGNTSSDPVPVATVSVCPAASLSTVSCASGFGFNGSFFAVPAPGGPDVVTVSSAGYAPDSIWVNVSVGANVSVGTIPLYPMGVLAGRVVDPNGLGLYLADIRVCTISGAASCYTGGGSNLGTGISGTDGAFNGTVVGGWLPWTTYVVAATAPGYTTDWTFGNVSVGGFTTVPTLTLRPIGVNGTDPVRLGPHSASTSSGPSTAGTWLAGRIVNNLTGAGVFIPPGAGLNACPFGSVSCDPIADGSNTEGFFNGSIAPGLYFLNVTPSGYTPRSIFINATQSGFIDLGSIALDPDRWVSGRVIINQWPSVTLSNGGTYGNGYGPAATVMGCDPSRITCVNGLPVSTSGYYNVSIPAGPRATIVASPSGPAYGPSPSGGFDQNFTTTNITDYWTNLSGTNAYIALDIYGFISGRVWDNDSLNESSVTNVPAYGLPYASVQLFESGNHTGSVGTSTDGGGFWTILLPGGNGPNQTRYQISDAPAHTQLGGIYPGAIQFGDRPIGLYNNTLNRFGWIQAEFVATGTGLPVPFVQTSTAGVDPKTGNTYTGTDVADGNGFVNVSAAPFLKVHVQATAPDFNATSFVVAQVNRSATSYANGTSYANLAGYSLPAYGWVVGASLNFSNGNAPPLDSIPPPVVVDPAVGVGVPGASVTVSSSDSTITGGGSANTNWNGQFYSDAPIGFQDTLSVTKEGFVTNNSIEAVHSGAYLTLSTVNLTGETVLAGMVDSDPFHQPIAGATVQACVAVKLTQQCASGTTNLSGSFWIASAPGAVSLTVSAPNFVSSTSFVLACSDCWVWAGTVSLAQYATITGIVRGLPSGFPITGANVSLCATTASPAGPCGTAVQTDAFGHFVLSGPPASYILMASDPNYNSSYLPVAMSPGQTTTVGTLFLSQFGSASGTIYDGSTFAPLSGASVYGCAKFGQGGCAPVVTTRANGVYTFSAAPGPYEVSVTAQNYQSAYGAVRIQAGTTTVVSPIVLYPIGTNSLVQLSGRVVAADAPGLGLGSAVVTAFAVNASAGSAPTATDGTFHFGVPYGTYVLQAAADGYQAENLTVVAHQSLGGILFELPTKTFEIRGVVSDGLNGQPLYGATIWSTTGSGANVSTGSPLTTTDPSGVYVLDLSNGTHLLEALGPATGAPTTYAPLSFTVTVNGASGQHDLSMTPPLVTLFGRVTDAATGLPLPHASVKVQGTLEDGYRYSRSFTTGADGSFATTVYAGTYSASSSYQQYLGKSQTFAATGPSSYVTLSLIPIGSQGVSGSGTPGVMVWAAGALAAAAILGAAVWAGRPAKPREIGPRSARSPLPPSGAK